ncbi:MAG: diacylglycerol kinase family protein [Ferruginibacter sp.]
MAGTSVLKLLFVINPSAGSNTNTNWEESINKYFTGKDFEVDCYRLEQKPDEEKLKKYIAAKKPDRIIAVGGDGTVTLLANIIAGTKTPLGILPGGSANGMAKELEIPSTPEDALKIIETGIVKNCDSITINKKNICLHLSDIGINAQLIKYFEEGKLRGMLGYAKMILKTLWRREKMQVIIQTKGLEVKRNAFMVILANASMYGTGAVINPDGKLDDGIFEVIVIRRLSIFSILKTVFNPKVFNPKHFEIFPSTSVEINTLKRVHFQIDGEYLGKIKNIQAQINPGNINLIVPGE